MRKLFCIQDVFYTWLAFADDKVNKRRGNASLVAGFQLWLSRAGVALLPLALKSPACDSPPIGAVSEVARGATMALKFRGSSQRQGRGALYRGCAGTRRAQERDTTASIDKHVPNWRSKIRCGGLQETREFVRVPTDQTTVLFAMRRRKLVAGQIMFR